MPASPADAADLAAAIGAIYDDAEQALLAIVARALDGDADAPGWARQKLAAVHDVQRAVAQVVAALRHDASGAVSRAVRTAYERGTASAVADLGALPEGIRAFVGRVLPQAHAIDRLAHAAVAEHEPVWARILRAPVDAYRRIIARVTGSVLTGALTRRQVAQRALDQFAAAGISGFTDRAGRRWQLASYAEMAVRTAAGRAAIQGHTDRLAAAGQQLVVVSDAPLECPLCRPWEGRVLALSGAPGPREVAVQHATRDGETVRVHVAGTLPEARAAGLLHPNCRHNVGIYLPGITRRPQSPPHPQGATYEDTQRQRYYERQVRAWKRRQAVALDEAARRRAGRQVRAYQARIRDLTRNRGLPRQSAREQIGQAR